MSALEGSLYSIHSSQPSDTTGFVAEVVINFEHPIFEGHFPGQPVMPGVCMVNLIKDVLIKHYDSKWLLASASQLKFLNPILPATQLPIYVKCTELKHVDSIKTIEAQLYNKEQVFLKLMGSFEQLK